MEKTLFLEISWHSEKLKISCHDDIETRRKYEYNDVPMHAINDQCNQIADCINNILRQKNNSDEAYEKIKQVGRSLYDQLLTPSCKNKLSESDALYLIIQIDERLVNIPWELLFDNKGFLCQRFCMRRIVETQASVEKISLRKCTNDMQKLLIIANPDGDLASAGEEGIRLFKQANKVNRKKNLINPSLLSEVSADRVLKRLKDYDIVHFAGHVDYQYDQLDQSGWRLTNSFLKASDIRKLAGGAPMSSLVFSNACQSARTEMSDTLIHNQSGSFGLANAFLFSGVRHYIGSLWDVFDVPGNHFALAFYQSLFTGASIGQAMKNARFALINEYGESFIAWAGHILYGDPRTTYIDSHMKGAPQYKPPLTQTGKLRAWIHDYDIAINKWKGAIMGILLIIFLLCGFLWIQTLRESHDLNVQMYPHNQIQVYDKLMQQAEKRQKRTEQLVQEIKKKFPKAFRPAPISPDGWTSVEVPVAMNFESGLSDIAMGNAVLFAIQTQIMTHSGCISLLERKSLDVLLSEHLRSNNPPEILLPELTIFLETYQADPTLYLLMRLVHKSGRIMDNIFEQMDSGNVIAQRTKLAHQLLKALSRKYPVRGKITEISHENSQFVLNIGENVHVDIGDLFIFDVNDEMIIKISSVEFDKSTAVFVSGPMRPSLNMRVIKLSHLSNHE